MKKLRTKLIEHLAKFNAEYITSAKCYNYHSFVDKSKTSNLAKTIDSLPKPTENHRYLVVVGAKGRSQHSSTDLHIFLAKCDGTIGTYETMFRSYWWV